VDGWMDLALVCPLRRGGSGFAAAKRYWCCMYRVVFFR
jgi:hypothetical protein